MMGERSRDSSVDSHELFEQLDEYVEALHSGDANRRSGLFDRNPELQELLSCLDSLEMLAPTPANDNGSDDSRTPIHLEATDSDGNPQPQQFGKYELLRELGRGGMGVVYAARQTDLDRMVAVKMILSSHFASTDEVDRFYTEARAAGSLRHPNIIGIHEVGEVHGQHYFAMDYVSGKSLAEILLDGPFEPDRAALFLVSVCRAADYLHEHNIVHRDLKPSNILIAADDAPYLTDFGLAKVFSGDSSRTRTGMIVGTPSYMAPEQASGHGAHVTPQSDVYSLGAILYELLTGRPPFQRKNPLDTLVEVIEGEPIPPRKMNPQIPSELERVCLRCLQKDPEQRYASAAALANDLERYLRREPVEARAASFVETIRRWGRREPALVSRLAGLAVAATITQATYVIDGSDLRYHLNVMAIFACWAVLAVFFQKMMNREAWANTVRFAWSAADALMLTLTLCYVEAPIGPLLIGYPLLVAASGLFFRVRLVLFTTVACLLSYAGLTLWRPSDTIGQLPQYPVIFASVLAVLGLVVAYQVYRIRTLSRYFEHRRLP